MGRFSLLKEESGGVWGKKPGMLKISPYLLEEKIGLFA